MFLIHIIITFLSLKLGKELSITGQIESLPSPCWIIAHSVPLPCEGIVQNGAATALPHPVSPTFAQDGGKDVAEVQA